MRSLTVQLPEQVYADAERAVVAGGYEDMGSYVASLIACDNDHAPLSWESLQAIEESRAQFAAGEGRTLEQAKAELAAHRAEWLRANPQ